MRLLRRRPGRPEVTDPRAIEVEGTSRSAFLMRGMLATAAVYGAGAVGPAVARALQPEVDVRGGPGSREDLETLAFALLLERLESEYYERALSAGGLSGPTRALAAKIGENERQHVEKLITVIDVLGGRAERPPRFTFPASGEAGFLALAQVLEDTGVSAYNGAAPTVRSFEVLAAAGGIVQVEARHAAAIRMRRGQPVAPGAFSPALSDDEVLPQIDRYVIK